MTRSKLRIVLLATLGLGCSTGSSPAGSADAASAGPTDATTADSDGVAPHDGGSSSPGDASQGGDVAHDSAPDGGSVLLPPALNWQRENVADQLRSIWGSGPPDIYALGDNGLI